MKKELLPETDLLRCSHLTNSPKDIETVRGFEVTHPETGAGLKEYLKGQALGDERLGLMRSYLVRHKFTDECVGYFSLKAGLVSINEEVRQDRSVGFDTVPGIELANFAVNRVFQEKYHLNGLGSTLFRGLIAPLAIQLSEWLGIYLIYIFALPQPRLITAYEKYGFLRLKPHAEKALHHRLKPNYDASCIFMFQPLSHLGGA